MKFLVPLVSIFAISAHAQTLENRVAKLEAQMQAAQFDIQDLKHSSGGSSYTVVSSVDLSCVKTLDDAYPYSADFKMLVGWFQQCRTAPLSQPYCTVTNTQFTAVCFKTFDDMYPYTMDNAELTEVQNTCRTVSFQCH